MFSENLETGFFTLHFSLKLDYYALLYICTWNSVEYLLKLRKAAQQRILVLILNEKQKTNQLLVHSSITQVINAAFVADDRLTVVNQCKWLTYIGFQS